MFGLALGSTIYVVEGDDMCDVVPIAFSRHTYNMEELLRGFGVLNLGFGQRQAGILWGGSLVERILQISWDLSEERVEVSGFDIAGVVTSDSGDPFLL